MSRTFIASFVLFVACSSADTEGGGGQSQSSGGGSPDPVSCSEACARVEQVCADTWDSVDQCADTCISEPFSPSSLDCVMTANDCDDVDVCSD